MGLCRKCDFLRQRPHQSAPACLLELSLLTAMMLTGCLHKAEQVNGANVSVLCSFRLKFYISFPFFGVCVFEISGVSLRYSLYVYSGDVVDL